MLWRARAQVSRASPLACWKARNKVMPGGAGQRCGPTGGVEEVSGVAGQESSDGLRIYVRGGAAIRQCVDVVTAVLVDLGQQHEGVEPGRAAARPGPVDHFAAAVDQQVVGAQFGVCQRLAAQSGEGGVGLGTQLGQVRRSPGVETCRRVGRDPVPPGEQVGEIIGRRSVES